MRTRSASLVGSVEDWLELMITVDARILYLVGRSQRGLYNHTFPRINPLPFPHHRDHVVLCAFLHCASSCRVITSSLLFFRNALVSEAENSFGVKKKMACIGLRRIQARQQRSIRSVRRIITVSFLLGTIRSLPLECFQAPRKKESFVIDRTFFPIADCQT
jgi:hypothetical protein